MRRTMATAVGILLVGASLAAAQSTVPPLRKRALLKWLKTGSYRALYTAEPAVHVSLAGVHGMNVRTYYSPTLVEDLRAGRTIFRKDAAMVKELYFGGDQQVLGYSVMRKVRAKSGRAGTGWLFYETLDGTNRAASFGRGLGICVGCHRLGVDLLRSEFRP